MLCAAVSCCVRSNLSHISLDFTGADEKLNGERLPGGAGKARNLYREPILTEIDEALEL